MGEMMSEATKQIIEQQLNVEEAATVVALPTKPVEAPKKARTIEELENAGVRGMTETEKVKYINYLREEQKGLTNKIECLNQQLISAMTVRGEAEGKLEAIRADANKKISFLIGQIENVTATVNMVFKGGNN